MSLCLLQSDTGGVLGTGRLPSRRRLGWSVDLNLQLQVLALLGVRLEVVKARCGRGTGVPREQVDDVQKGVRWARPEAAQGPDW